MAILAYQQTGSRYTGEHNAFSLARGSRTHYHINAGARNKFLDIAQKREAHDLGFVKSLEKR